MNSAMDANKAERRPWWRRADLLSLGALLLLLGWAVPRAWRGFANALDVRPPSEVLFTGLDDSAQSMLARSIEAGAPLLFFRLACRAFSENFLSEKVALPSVRGYNEFVRGSSLEKQEKEYRYA